MRSVSAKMGLLAVPVKTLGIATGVVIATVQLDDSAVDVSKFVQARIPATAVKTDVLLCVLVRVNVPPLAPVTVMQHILALTARRNVCAAAEAPALIGSMGRAYARKVSEQMSEQMNEQMSEQVNEQTVQRILLRHHRHVFSSFV